MFVPRTSGSKSPSSMEGIKRTLDAAGATLGDVVHVFVFRARPRMGDIGRASAITDYCQTTAIRGGSGIGKSSEFPDGHFGNQALPEAHTSTFGKLAGAAGATRTTETGDG